MPASRSRPRALLNGAWPTGEGATGVGKPLPDLSAPLAKLEQALQAARLRVSVLRDARELAARELIFGTPPEDIIVEHLRPALAEVIEQVRDLEPKLEARSVEVPENFVRASETARQAVVTLGDLAFRYSAIRAGQQAGGRLLDGPQVDTGHKFSEFRNPQALGITIGGMAGRPQPVPEHRLTRFLWTATVGKDQVWMPLPAEQDEMANAYFKAADNRRLAGFRMCPREEEPSGRERRSGDGPEAPAAARRLRRRVLK